jgi:hypothetical protein
MVIGARSFTKFVLTPANGLCCLVYISCFVGSGGHGQRLALLIEPKLLGLYPRKEASLVFETLFPKKRKQTLDNVQKSIAVLNHNHKLSDLMK